MSRYSAARNALPSMSAIRQRSRISRIFATSSSASRLRLLSSTSMSGVSSGLRSAVASAGSGSSAGSALHERQHLHPPGLAGVVDGVRLEPVESRLGAEQPIDDVDDRLRAAARLVLRHLLRGELFLQVRARHVEEPRLRAPEAVDRLLRVAHHEHGRPHVRAHGRLEPALQRQPLQGVRVLELVEQDVAVAGVELVLHVDRVVAHGDEPPGVPLDVGVVDHLALPLHALVGLEKRDAAMEGRLVVAVARLVDEVAGAPPAPARRAVQCSSRNRALRRARDAARS